MWRVADYAVIFSNGKIHNFLDWSEPDLFSAKNKEMFVKSKPQSVNILKYNKGDNYDKNDKCDKYDKSLSTVEKQSIFDNRGDRGDKHDNLTNITKVYRRLKNKA